jgi:hypothetical protein
MKMQNLNLKIVAIVMISVLTILSCNKEENDNDITIAQDNAFTEGVYADVHAMVDQANRLSSTKITDSLWGAYFSSCVTITRDTLANPHKITIDFGATNCLCNDGKYRRGIIIASYTGRYRDAGTQISVSFNGFYVNDNHVQGTKTITNNGTNALGNINFDIAVNGQIDKANNGGTITWTSNRNREWIAGSSTLSIWDDIYLITGEADGSSNGTNFEILIINPLRKEIGCVNFVSGTFTLDIPQKALRTIDYGNGSCDQTATVTILNQTYTITLN